MTESYRKVILTHVFWRSQGQWSPLRDQRKEKGKGQRWGKNRKEPSGTWRLWAGSLYKNASGLCIICIHSHKLPHTQLCLSYLKGLEMVQQLRAGLIILAKAATWFLAPALDSLQLPGIPAPRRPILSSELCWYPHPHTYYTWSLRRQIGIIWIFPFLFMCVHPLKTHVNNLGECLAFEAGIEV